MTAPDHLRVWLEVRDATPWHRVRRTPPEAQAIIPLRDGPAHDIRTRDHRRDPVRAARLLAALARARADAESGAVLGFEVLSAWQRCVLDVAEAPFRARPAFAKGGRERYGAGPGLRDRFERCLAQAHDPELPLPARAARLYLDVCFFHPFDDGNARSAFLALTFLLARSGVALDQVAPVRSLPRRADDPEDALALADLVAILIANTARRGRVSTPF
ncbi:Fic family protein [Amycolatopsis sp. NBC_00355]|uniref:Fic family protein n=1 Tax=Amycolatopsis sp. NBC_00355 TaxID=2975957 RepID=UPI002E256694